MSSHRLPLKKKHGRDEQGLLELRAELAGTLAVIEKAATNTFSRRVNAAIAHGLIMSNFVAFFGWTQHLRRGPVHAHQ